MSRGFFPLIRRGAHQLVQPYSGMIQKFLCKRRRSKARGEAYRLDYAGKYPEAADVFTRLAESEVQSNELIYQLYNHYAFNMWLKAKNVEAATEVARDVLRVLSKANWLTKSSDAVDDLSKMVGELYVAGFTTQAKAFSKEINGQLVAHGLAPRSTTAGAPASPPETRVGVGRLPSICPECGGMLPDTGHEDEVKFPFGYVALTPVEVYNTQPLHLNVAVTGIGEEAYFNNGADARQLWVKMNDQVAFVVAFGDQPREEGAKALARLVAASLK